MNAFIQQLLLLSLSGTFSILLICILKKLYQNHFSKRWQYYIWLLAILRFLLPFAPDTKALSSLIGTGRIQAVQQAVLKTDWVTSRVGSAYNPLADSFANEQMLDTGNLQEDDCKSSLFAIALHCLPAGILTAWLVMALHMFTRRIGAYRKFMHDLCSADTAVSDNRLLHLLAVCKKACGVTKPVVLYRIPELASPVMAGLFHPCIAIPDHSFSDTELSFIFLHELTHYRQRDLIYKWLIQAVVCIHWFNPFVYFLEKEVNNACELACDESVIRFLPKEAKKAYGDTLLLCSKTACQKNSSGLSLALTEGAQLLKERLGAIMKYKQLTKKTKIATIIFTAGICFGSATFGAYATPSSPAPFKQADSQTDEKTNKTTAVADDFNSYTPENDASEDIVSKLPAKLTKILTLQTKNYKDYTLQQFSDYISEQYEADEALWKASQRYQTLLDEKTVHKLSGDEYTFLTVTLPCTTSESTYPYDRVGSIPPGFGGQYDLPYKKHNTKIHFEWQVQYEIQNPKLTVGERDKLILNVINGMDQFVKHTPDTIDIGSEDYTQKMRNHLEQMVKENSGSGLEMVVFQCG